MEQESKQMTELPEIRRLCVPAGAPQTLALDNLCHTEGQTQQRRTGAPIRGLRMTSSGTGRKLDELAVGDLFSWHGRTKKVLALANSGLFIGNDNFDGSTRDAEFIRFDAK